MLNFTRKKEYDLTDNDVILKNHIKVQLEFYNIFRQNISGCCDSPLSSSLD